MSSPSDTTFLLRIFLALLSSFLLTAAFPEPDVAYLAWFALVPLFYGLWNAGAAKSFFTAYLAGVFFMAGTFYWLHHVSWLGFFVLVSVLSLFHAVFGYFTFLAFKIFPPFKRGGFLIFVIPSLWSALEFLRGNLLGGFPWAFLGHTQYRFPVITQIADLTGTYGVSFLVVMVNTALFICVLAPHARRTAGLRKREIARGLLWVSAITIIAVLAVLSYGMLRLEEPEEKAPGADIRIAVLQGNIPQEMKWDPYYRDFIMERYEDLTREAVSSGADLVVWPETSFPDLIEDGHIPRRLLSLPIRFDTPMLIGAIMREEDGGTYRHYNSALLLEGGPEGPRIYRKTHLVPFGEYIPFEEKLGFFRKFIDKPIGCYSPGDEYTVFEIRKAGALDEPLRFGVLICFEDIFPYLARRFAGKGADLLINITNDAWFGESGEQLQHGQASVFRSIETRTDVIRAANTGLSCHVSPNGEIAGSIREEGRGIYTEGYGIYKVTTGSRLSRYPFDIDTFGRIVSLAAAFFVLVCLWKRRRS